MVIVPFIVAVPGFVAVKDNVVAEKVPTVLPPVILIVGVALPEVLLKVSVLVEPLFVFNDPLIFIAVPSVSVNEPEYAKLVAVTAVEVPVIVDEPSIFIAPVSVTKSLKVAAEVEFIVKLAAFIVHPTAVVSLAPLLSVIALVPVISPGPDILSVLFVPTVIALITPNEAIPVILRFTVTLGPIANE